MFPAIQEGLLQEGLLKKFLSEQAGRMEIVMTGRTPPQGYLEQADYVTEMKLKKHPYDQGADSAAGRGILTMRIVKGTVESVLFCAVLVWRIVAFSNAVLTLANNPAMLNREIMFGGMIFLTDAELHEAFKG